MVSADGYLTRLAGQLAAAGLRAEDDPPWLPHLGCGCTALVDFRLEFPRTALDVACMRVLERIDTRRGDDPRVAYVYQLVVLDKPVRGWHRHATGPHAYDHIHTDYRASGSTRIPSAPVTLMDAVREARALVKQALRIPYR